MSDSAHIEHLLSGFLDDQLSNLEKHQVETHLQGCKTCERHRQELLHVRQLLKTSPVLTPPESFYRAVHRRIDQQQTAGSLWGRPLKVAASVTAVLMVGLITWQAREKTQKEQEPMLAFRPPPESPPVIPTRQRELRSTLSSKDKVRQEEILERREVAVEKKVIPTDTFEGNRQGLGTSRLKSNSPLRYAAPAAAREVHSSSLEWQGLDSNLTLFQTYTIYTPEQMEALWQKHAPDELAPDIDFQRFMVVGVTGAALLRIDSTASTLIVYYRSSRPSAYHFQVIPKTSLPVQFQAQ